MKLLPSQIELQIRNSQQAELQIPLNALGINDSLIIYSSINHSLINQLTIHFYLEFGI